MAFRQTPFGLLIPPSIAEPPKKKYRCAVPIDEHGTACGKPFNENEKQQFIRHVNACSKKHEGEIEAITHARETNVFTSIDDIEAHKFFREHGHKPKHRPRERSRAKGAPPA